MSSYNRHMLTPKEHRKIQRSIRFGWICEVTDAIKSIFARRSHAIEAELQESADRIEQLEALSPTEK